jgi:predicted DNA-binding antitoxin AbrB/MazE fold protein
MNQPLVIRGRYSKQVFIPSEPLPLTDGTAELVIVPDRVQPTVSIFDLIGQAEVKRTIEDIHEQVRQERDAWGES